MLLPAAACLPQSKHGWATRKQRWHWMALPLAGCLVPMWLLLMLALLVGCSWLAAC
jgi:hypothetical protein